MDGEVVATRNPLGRFQPGASGNPGGRNAMDPAVREALEAASPLAAQRLVELLDHPDPVIRLKAIDMLQNRIYGRPLASVDQKIERTDVGALHLRALQDLMAKGNARKAGVDADLVDVTPIAAEVAVVVTGEDEDDESDGN